MHCANRFSPLTTEVDEPLTGVPHLVEPFWLKAIKLFARAEQELFQFSLVISVKTNFDGSQPAALRAAFLTLDRIVLSQQLKKRPSVMKSAHFLKGPFCNALRLALEEAVSEDVIRERGWKLWLLLPRMLLFRPPEAAPGTRETLQQLTDESNILHG